MKRPAPREMHLVVTLRVPAGITKRNAERNLRETLHEAYRFAAREFSETPLSIKPLKRPKP